MPNIVSNYYLTWNFINIVFTVAGHLKSQADIAEASPSTLQMKKPNVMQISCHLTKEINKKFKSTCISVTKVTKELYFRQIKFLLQGKCNNGYTTLSKY